MDGADIPFSISDLSQRTHEQAEFIQSVLEDVKPIQTKLLGEKTVRAISRGAAFESIEGGRHLNFMEIISVLSNIATITQITVLAVIGIRRLRSEAARRAEEKEEAKKVVMEKISSHPELSDLGGLIVADPIILNRIVEKVTASLNNP